MGLTLEFGSFGKPENPALIILHGLLGSSRNWLSIGKDLSEFYNVFLVDQRNHGNSPHQEPMNYEMLLRDFEHWVDRKKLGTFYVMGHSMGGKVAMAYACKHHERLKGLIIEDIAPKAYTIRFAKEFEAMNSLDLSLIKSRSDADEMLMQKIPTYEMRQFILTNLIKDPERGYIWRINLPILTRDLFEMMKNPLKENDVYKGHTLVLQGEKSDYIENSDYDTLRKHFPKCAILKIENAGHNVHIDAKDEVVKALSTFVHL